MRISDWSSDVCSSDLDLVASDEGRAEVERVAALPHLFLAHGDAGIPVARLLELPEFLRAVGVATLADRKIGVLLAQRDRAVKRGDRRRPVERARPDRRAQNRPRPPPQQTVESQAVQEGVE